MRLPAPVPHPAPAVGGPVPQRRALRLWAVLPLWALAALAQAEGSSPTSTPTAAQGAAWDANAGVDAEAVQLKPSALLLDRLPEAARTQSPTFVWGERISGQAGVQTVVEGNAELRRHDTVIWADRLQLDHAQNEAQATGHATIVRNGNRFEGPELSLNLDSYVGFFTAPRYELLANEGRGEASRVDFQGENLSIAHDATYTTCQAPPGALPDWWVGARRLELDNADEVGRASGGALYFKGVPLLAAPYVSFPLSDKRKSGLLPPTINLTNLSGLEVTLPYYWNIAPQLDATLYPTLMTSRGVDLGGEFRYLQPDQAGQLRANYMAHDTLRGQSRWGYALQHQQALESPWSGLAGTGLRFNLNRVSDDDYWSDFPRTSPALTQRLLPNDAVLSGQLGPVALSAGLYTWQTLQNASAPITAPYDRAQADARWGQLNQSVGSMGGFDWSLTGQLTRFTTARSPSVTATLADINGNRMLGIAQISRPWQAPGWFVRPKAQLHLTQYQFDQDLIDGRRSASRVLPTLSLDSGLVYERETQWLGRSLLQTLEPRAFYLHTPYRDQSALPNYDSAAKDFNFGTAWGDNVFGGNDRIADTHALTLGVSSRLIDPTTGAESARVGIAQRLRLADQNVYLPGGAPVTDRLSDILLGTTINWDPQWSFDSTVQFNPKSNRSQRTTITGRYHPRPYHTFSSAYRLQRAGGLLPASEQVDFGWQWPLDAVGWGAPEAAADAAPRRWYGVGRINYSMPDRKVVDLIAGFEYDAGCWMGRLVLERLQRGAAAAASQRVLFQLEFTGFTRIGANPLQTLRDNVPRYMTLKEQVQVPSRFGRYE